MDPVESRRIFIRQALVEGDYDTRAPFFLHNRRLVREIEQLEHKSRRPDVLVDDELICAFYESLVPEGIHNGADFDRWRREAESANPKLLFLKREDLMRHEAAGSRRNSFRTSSRWRTQLRARLPSRAGLAARRRDAHRALLALNQVDAPVRLARAGVAA